MHCIFKSIIVFGFVLQAAFFSTSSQTYALDFQQPNRPHLLMDAKSGEILSIAAPFLRWAPASLTKMMTAYTVFRQLDAGHIDMKSPVRVSRYALRQPPSKMGMPVGTIMTVEAALNIIMVKSANDISVALAESVSGSERKFVKLMNSYAKEIGMVDSNFVNPHGLSHDRQYTSARDMALLAVTITKDLRKYDRFFNIPGIRVGGRRLRNHNALVERFPGTNGMKTGYVCASGFNVVVRTKRDGRELIAVVFGGKTGRARNVKAAQLLQGGFDGRIKPLGLKLDTYVRPFNASKIPYDIAHEMCPRQYRKKSRKVETAAIIPNPRPADAPKAEDFDSIDTQIPAPEKGKKKSAEKIDTKKLPVIIPSKRPNVVVASNSAKIANLDVTKAKGAKKPKAVAEKAIPEDKPPTLSELEAVYLTKRIRPRDDVRVKLGGAIGRNPNGIKHTNGGVYVAPAPKVVAEGVKPEAEAEAVVGEKPEVTDTKADEKQVEETKTKDTEPKSTQVEKPKTVEVVAKKPLLVEITSDESDTEGPEVKEQVVEVTKVEEIETAVKEPEVKGEVQVEATTVDLKEAKDIEADVKITTEAKVDEPKVAEPKVAEPKVAVEEVASLEKGSNNEAGVSSEITQKDQVLIIPTASPKGEQVALPTARPGLENVALPTARPDLKSDKAANG